MYDLRTWTLLSLLQPPKGASQSSTPSTLFSLAVCVLFLASQAVKTLSLPAHAQAPYNPLPTPSSDPQSTPLPSPTTTPEPTETPTGTDVASLIVRRPAIEQYIKTIFPDNWKTAIAVASVESGKVDPKTRQFYYAVNAVNKSEVELSIGLFQVNLRSQSTLVHYERIPGHTEKEKVEWLKNPYNNTLFAFWIYSTSGFHPWTAYSSGKYLAFIGKP
jgi:hypothetical protein